MPTKVKSLALLSVLVFGAMTSSKAVPNDPRNVNPVEVGSTLPVVNLTNESGKPVSLREALGGGKAVIIFYRGSWCPYCTKHLSAVGQHEDKILNQGYKIIALSPDKPAVIEDYAKEADLNYELYSDSEMAAATAFGLTFKLDEATLAKLDSYDIDIEAASGKKHHLLPVPAVFISDEEGRITFRYYNPDYKKRLSPEELLGAIE
ncbi:antioxidant AhpC [Coraliomargarita sinensis]|uniref:thioredoxin-dependent peroxiredoxin n=1 Tax=Coraliomargarita sinensis TaxID=2174842 RepID=A0A317ZM91_9BACT|nr:peroxiredoxin-like family protein [Coraliomargarita sinensis]PXA05048.1 antioxidant AhpC [Coraliomargarita sinensis]